MKRLITILAIVLFTVVTSAAFGKSLQIGMIASLSGPMSPEFKEMLETVEATKQLINNVMGGIKVKGTKYEVEILVEDDKSSPEGAVAAANKLIGKGIKFMVAPLFLPTNMAIADMCEKQKVFRMTPICINPAAVAGPGGGKYCFISNTTGKPNIRAMYKYLREKYPSVKRVGILIIDDPGVMPGKDWEKEELTAHGMEVVYEGAYPIPTDDFYPILSKLLAKKPDAIAGVVSAIAFAAAIVNQARELGFRGPIYWSCGAGDINAIYDMVKPGYRYDIVNGLPDVLSPQMPPLVKKLRELMAKRGKVLRYTGTLTFDCVYNLKQAIEAAQSLDVQEVVRALESMDHMDTIYGKAELKGEEFGIPPKHMILEPRWFSKIEDGKVRTWVAK